MNGRKVSGTHSSQQSVVSVQTRLAVRLPLDLLRKLPHHAQQQSAGYERNEPGHLDAEVVLITQRLREGEARGSGISSEQ